MEVLSKVKKVEEGEFINKTFSNSLIEDVDLDCSIGAVSKSEDGNFFNLNLSSAYIEDVDFDAVFNTIEKIETYNSYNDPSVSNVNGKYYKMVITKTGNGKDRWGTTLAHGVFENLTYTGRKTQNYTANITSVDVYFADESENVIECTCSYLSGRWSDNGHNNYAPCDFFATSQEQAWDDNDNAVSYSEIMSNNKNSDLIVEFSFKTKMPLENLNNLTFDNGRYSASNVNVKVYSSDDLETYTEIIDMDLASGSSYTFTFDPSTI